MKHDRVRHTKWDLETLAHVGALLGLLPVSAHQIHSLYIGDLHSDDPLLHLIMELIGATLGGALLLWAIGWIRNRQVTQNGRRKQSAASQPEQ